MIDQDKYKASHFKNKHFQDNEQGTKPGKERIFYKTHEGFYPKNNYYKKDRNYEYENRKDREIDDKFDHNQYNKQNKQSRGNKYIDAVKESIKEDPERGEECKKVNNIRKEENKAIFAHQLKNIQKTIKIDDAGIKRLPPYGGVDRHIHKESKITALAGSGIINDKHKNTDDFIISGLNNDEEKKYPSATEPTKSISVILN